MKPNYKNWIPKGMLFGLISLTVILLIGMIISVMTDIITSGMLKSVLSAFFTIAFIICAISTIWCIFAYNMFSYNGKRQLSKQIITGIADYIDIKSGGLILDIGCGSGALSIACAKKNPNSKVIGIDRWGKEYASFSKQLCDKNAQAEGVSNTEFLNGNAVKLDFCDESFDAVTSNYVYHNIGGHNKQELLLETLRVLKNGGTFAIHDIMSDSRYGDMKKFARSLKAQGYKKVELIHTDHGKFISKKESNLLMLKGSILLHGIK